MYENCFGVIYAACVWGGGLSPDCEKLQRLRQFRDTYMQGDEQRKRTVKEYYASSEWIIRAIKLEAGAQVIWETMYTEMVRPTVALLKAALPREAMDFLTLHMAVLENRFLL